mmetsp:Transcript_21519/g.56113  ORF Transcript_21519/g.56113 Transcript_21519/m.56113 type:complete len:760 (+) Transcript_21519:129-2408(+)
MASMMTGIAASESGAAPEAAGDTHVRSGTPVTFPCPQTTLTSAPRTAAPAGAVAVRELPVTAVPAVAPSAVQELPVTAVPPAAPSAVRELPVTAVPPAVEPSTHRGGTASRTTVTAYGTGYSATWFAAKRGTPLVVDVRQPHFPPGRNGWITQRSTRGLAENVSGKNDRLVVYNRGAHPYAMTVNIVEAGSLHQRNMPVWEGIKWTESHASLGCYLKRWNRKRADKNLKDPPTFLETPFHAVQGLLDKEKNSYDRRIFVLGLTLVNAKKEDERVLAIALPVEKGDDGRMRPVWCEESPITDSLCPVMANVSMLKPCDIPPESRCLAAEVLAMDAFEEARQQVVVIEESDTNVAEDELETDCPSSAGPRRSSRSHQPVTRMNMTHCSPQPRVPKATQSAAPRTKAKATKTVNASRTKVAKASRTKAGATKAAKVAQASRLTRKPRKPTSVPGKADRAVSRRPRHVDRDKAGARGVERPSADISPLSETRAQLQIEIDRRRAAERAQHRVETVNKELKGKLVQQKRQAVSSADKLRKSKARRTSQEQIAEARVLLYDRDDEIFRRDSRRRENDHRARIQEQELRLREDLARDKLAMSTRHDRWAFNNELEAAKDAAFRREQDGHDMWRQRKEDERAQRAALQDRAVVRELTALRGVQRAFGDMEYEFTRQSHSRRSHDGRGDQLAAEREFSHEMRMRQEQRRDIAGENDLVADHRRRVQYFDPPMSAGHARGEVMVSADEEDMDEEGLHSPIPCQNAPLSD